MWIHGQRYPEAWVPSLAIPRVAALGRIVLGQTPLILEGLNLGFNLGGLTGLDIFEVTADRQPGTRQSQANTRN